MSPFHGANRWQWPILYLSQNRHVVLPVYLRALRTCCVEEIHLLHVLALGAHEGLYVALHHAPEVQRDVEETRHAVSHKPLAFPCKFRFVPWGGIELRTAFSFHCFNFSFLANVSDHQRPATRIDRKPCYCRRCIAGFALNLCRNLF